MRKFLIIVTVLAVAGIIAYTQWPKRPVPPPDNTPPEKLVELDPNSPVDRALGAYLDAVASLGQYKPETKVSSVKKDPNAPQEAAEESKKLHEHMTNLLARFEGRTKLLAAAPVQLIDAMRAYTMAVQGHEKVVREKFPGGMSADRLSQGLLGPVLDLT